MKNLIQNIVNEVRMFYDKLALLFEEAVYMIYMMGELLDSF